MKIFNNLKPISGPQKPKENTEARVKARMVGGRRVIQHTKNSRRHLSNNEIRQKIFEQQHKKELGATNKAQFKKRSAMFETLNMEHPQGPGGDVGHNNPNDPATRGKLKKLLSSGGIHFDQKTKSVLSQILKDE